MIRFFRARGASLAVIVLVMFLISTAQGAISYSVGRGPLRAFVPPDLPAVLTVLYATRIVLLALLTLLWVLNRKRALFHTIIVANSYFTLKLLLDTIELIGGARSMGNADERAASVERSHRGDGQQTCPNYLGNAGASTALPEGL